MPEQTTEQQESPVTSTLEIDQPYPHSPEPPVADATDPLAALPPAPPAPPPASTLFLAWLKRHATAIVVIGILLIAVVAIQPGDSIALWILVAVVAAALGFDFVNGMNDAANAIATVVSTRVLTPLAALIMASVLNFAGALVHEGVAKFVAKDIVNPLEVTSLMILCGLLGAVIWSWLMTRFGLPISLSHALIGGLVGVVLAAQATLNTPGIMKVVIWMMAAPILGFVGGFLLMLIIMWLFHRATPHKINRHFRFWQLVSSAFMAFSHGGNDAQKAMGVITLALVAAGVQTVAPGEDPAIQLWVKIVCASIIALGTGIGGWRVIRTLGHKMIKLAPVHGFAAETAAAVTIQLATVLHAPVSTTHVISSSIMGVGASKRLSAVRWGVATNIVVAWVFTIPVCGTIGAVLFLLAKGFGLAGLLGM